MSFEEKIERLEELNGKMKDGNLPLETAMKYFEEGMKLASGLEKELSKVERRIEILKNKPDTPEEKPVLELFPELSEEN